MCANIIFVITHKPRSWMAMQMLLQLYVHVGESHCCSLPLLLADAAVAAAVATAAVSVSDRDTVPDALALSCAHLNNYTTLKYIIHYTRRITSRTLSPSSFLHKQRVQQIQKLNITICLYIGQGSCPINIL